MKQEAKLVSRCYSVSVFHRPFSWWKSGHDVPPNNHQAEFQDIPAKEAALRVPFLGILSSPLPSIRKSVFFCLELELFILMKAWALASQWESFAFPPVFLNNSSTSHKGKTTVKFHIFKCCETLLHPPPKSLYLAFLAQACIFQHHSISPWKEEKENEPLCLARDTGCPAGPRHVGEHPWRWG